MSIFMSEMESKTKPLNFEVETRELLTLKLNKWKHCRRLLQKRNNFTLLLEYTHNTVSSKWINKTYL